ncbi:hypothetical protein DL96DRAFT_849585 [Flagelloscypha sp. PMI_526]|nr:hypothetical protein DL96DRAFT_849585 [Flagelloscypha sp. PMI_526]
MVRFSHITFGPFKLFARCCLMYTSYPYFLAVVAIPQGGSSAETRYVTACLPSSSRHSTMSWVFSESSTESAAEMEYLSKSLSHRSAVVSASILAIVAFISSVDVAGPTKFTPSLILPFTILLLGSLTRAFFEGLPLALFQERIRIVTPTIVTILYSLPELYLVVFMTYQGYSCGGVITLTVMLTLIVLHALIVLLPFVLCEKVSDAVSQT